MAYTVYLNGVPLPVTPSAIMIQTPNRNEKVELIDGSEISILKEPGLKTIQFECLIPQVSYPFSYYNNGKFRKAKEYLDEFEALKKSKLPFRFLLARFVKKDTLVKGVNTNNSFNTNMSVSLEDWSQVDDASNGFDLKVSINLQEYVDFGTKEFIIATDPASTPVAEPVEPERPVDPVPISPGRRTYAVKSGDSLWAICARELGDGGKCWDVAKQNDIANPDLIFPDQVIDLTGF